MSDHSRALVREQLLRAPPARVFEFFGNPANLEQLTPPWLRFQILTPMPLEMRAGARIDYRLRLAGIPLRWRTCIQEWRPGESFIDVQERGPFARWEHSHRFEVVGDCVHMLDRVVYELPLGAPGHWLAGIPVRAALDAIFDYRYAQIERQISR